MAKRIKFKTFQSRNIKQDCSGVDTVLKGVIEVILVCDKNIINKNAFQ